MNEKIGQMIKERILSMKIMVQGETEDREGSIEPALIGRMHSPVVRDKNFRDIINVFDERILLNDGHIIKDKIIAQTVPINQERTSDNEK
jgi:hypothetical protein